MHDLSPLQQNQDLQIREIARDGVCELFATISAIPAGGLASSIDRLTQAYRITPVAAECFGVSAQDRIPAGLPLTRVNGKSTGNGLGGVHIRAVRDVEVTPLVLDGTVVGSVINGPYAAECLVAGIHATDTTAPAAAQARVTFESIEQALSLAGMDFGNVARTWLFLDDILAWYDDFNVVRTTFFNERGVFDGLVPASTGIGGGNPAGAAMVAGCYAIRSKSPEVSVQAVPSPLQCPALDYGSSFSRAVEVEMPDIRRLFISGTASISPDGKTRHVGDVDAQAELTSEVVGAVLHSRDMNWHDVTRATAYVRFPRDAGVVETFRLASGRPNLPVIVTHNTICRDELLVELEVDAVKRQ